MGGAGSPSNTMRPGSRPICLSSFISIHPMVWQQHTNVTSITDIDRTDRQDNGRGQRSDSMGQTVLQTVTPKLRGCKFSPPLPSRRSHYDVIRIVTSFATELATPTVTDTLPRLIYKELECGPMPNLMAALTNIGGALCSTTQSLADAHY